MQLCAAPVHISVCLLMRVNARVAVGKAPVEAVLLKAIGMCQIKRKELRNTTLGFAVMSDDLWHSLYSHINAVMMFNATAPPQT